MKVIVLISNTCSNVYFKQIQEMKSKEKLAPSQKYFDMLIHGLNQIEDVHVVCLTARSIDPSNCSTKYLEEYHETVDNIDYYYTSVINLKAVKNINNIIQGCRVLKKIQNEYRNDDIYYLFDVLSYDISAGAILVTPYNKRSAVLTDLPSMISVIGKGKQRVGIIGHIKTTFTMKLMKSYSLYCLLTESMSNFINDRPYVVIEGMIPDDADNIIDEHSQNSFGEKKIVVYAGGLYEKFGIKNLVDAFCRIDELGAELQLYGEGPCVEYILEMGKKYPNIKYGGMISLDEVVERERQATLLINPRPANEEFTRYSFPSKTLEYMMTGRPVMSTKLAGIPDEYWDYLYRIDDYTVEGLKRTISEKLRADKNSLEKMGASARIFVLENKNAKRQAAKLKEAICENCK